MADTILAIEYIVRTPGVMGGKPRIAGQRVSVQNIVVLHEMHHWSVEQIEREIDLSPAQIYAALSYYHDHKQEIDQSIKDAEAMVKAVGTSFDEVKRRARERGMKFEE